MTKELKHIVSYICNHKLLSVIGSYFIISIFLKSFFKINITIPCLWTAIFGHRCFGCGTTRAFVELTHFDFKGAFDANPLIFILIPAFSYYIISDFLKFRKKQSTKETDC